MSVMSELFGWSTGDVERRWRACSSRLPGNMSTLNFQPLCEPRGFIRIIQIILAIVAFSLICDYKGDTKLTVPCPKGAKKVWTVHTAYPFSSNVEKFYTCENSKSSVHVIPCGVRGPAELLVAIGVISMIVGIIAVPIYVLKADMYENNAAVPFIDLAVTVLLTLMWFIAACAWAAAAVALKNATKPEGLAAFVDACVTNGKPSCTKNNETPGTTKLDFSIVFGFLNIFVWAGSCWFVYKDTRLHRRPDSGPPSNSWPPVPPEHPAHIGTTTINP